MIRSASSNFQFTKNVLVGKEAKHLGEAFLEIPVFGWSILSRRLWNVNLLDLDVRHAENIYKQMGKEGKILLTDTQMREVTIHAEDKQSTNRKKEDT